MIHHECCVTVHIGSPPQTGTGTLIVTLKDINDNFPVFAKDYRPVVYENEEAFKTVIQISAMDPDTATNGPPFEFWLPCGGGCPCRDNPTCGLFGFKFIPGVCPSTVLSSMAVVRVTSYGEFSISGNYLQQMNLIGGHENVFIFGMR